MSAQFRKRPVVIDAVQFNGTRDWSEAPEWLIRATQKAPWEDGSIYFDADGCAFIWTLEGAMAAQPGDWIIRGVKGEIYPCKPDIFAATYAAADEVAPEVAELLAYLEAIAVCRHDQDDEHRMRHMASRALQAYKEGAAHVV
jgi:hypothetical protein